MRIGVLGPLEVETASGEPRPPGGARQRRLLAALALARPRSASTDRLVELVWDDEPPVDPIASLRTQVSRLRSFLREAGGGDDAVHAEVHGYRLAGEGLVLDAEHFRALLARARVGEDPDAELGLLDEALALWRGDPFADLPERPEVLGPVRSLHELRFGALERRVDLLLRLGRLPEALSTVEPLIVEDPLREGPRALLMTALWRSGRAHEALSAFHEYRRMLADELGLGPSPALRRLQGEILGQDGAQAAASLEDPEPPGATGSADSPSGARLGPAAAPTPGLAQDVRFCRAGDGVRLAYATIGKGPPLVKAANWLNHIEYDWESPVWRRLFRELAATRTLVRYDERGTGLSDRDVADISMAAWVRDLEAVVDAAELDRFPLLGISQGCAVCIEYAARHPERVTGLILHGGYAAGWRADPSTLPAEAARRDASIEIVRHGWGEDTPAYRQMFTLTFIPGGTAEEVAWFNELQRRTVSPEMAARFMEAFATIDVRDRLAEVRAPTLVLHSRGDQRIPCETGMRLAAAIPGARFVMLESTNHLILEHEPAFGSWLAEARRFLEAELAP